MTEAVPVECGAQSWTQTHLIVSSWGQAVGSEKKEHHVSKDSLCE
jgi:hypothetical protein